MKKCTICEENIAEYNIKDTSDYYCQDCALEFFSDLSVLEKLECEAQAIKKIIDKKLN